MNRQEAKAMSSEISEIFTAAGLVVVDGAFSLSSLRDDAEVSFRMHFADGQKWVGSSVQDAVDFVNSLKKEVAVETTESKAPEMNLQQAIEKARSMTNKLAIVPMSMNGKTVKNYAVCINRLRDGSHVVFYVYAEKPFFEPNKMAGLYSYTSYATGSTILAGDF